MFEAKCTNSLESIPRIDLHMRHRRTPIISRCSVLEVVGTTLEGVYMSSGKVLSKARHLACASIAASVSKEAYSENADGSLRL